MRPTARQLADRDMAKAALLGAFDGTHFGVEQSPFGADDVGADEMGNDYDELDEDDTFGEEVAGEFGGRHHRRRGRHHGRGAPAPAPVVMARPQPAPAMPRMTEEERRALWEHRERKARTRQHHRELFPNEGSDIKLAKSSFSLTNNGPALILGDTSPISFSGMPDATIRPKRVIMNAPMPGFATITEIKVGVTSVTLGGNADAFEFSPLAVETSLSLPTMGQSTRGTVLGTYTGFYPSGMTRGNPYPFTITFQGVSRLQA